MAKGHCIAAQQLLSSVVIMSRGQTSQLALMLLLEKIAEQQIAAARDRGELDNLPGQGKPLALDDDVGVPQDLRAGYRVLMNGGFIPPEICHLKEFRDVESMLRHADTDQDKKSLLLRLSMLRSKLPALRLTTSYSARYRDQILQKLAE